MNNYLKVNEHIIRITSNIVLMVAFVVFVTFSVMNTLERNKQHDSYMIEMKQEKEKQRDLRIKQEILYDEIHEHYKKLKVD